MSASFNTGVGGSTEGGRCKYMILTGYIRFGGSFGLYWCFWTVVLEKTLESPLDFKESQPIHSKGDQSWVFGRNDAKAETPVLRLPDAKNWLTGKDPAARKRLKARGEGDDRGWDNWMASLTQRTWIWASSRSWWWTGRPGMLRFMGSQRVGHDWVTELNWTELMTLANDDFLFLSFLQHFLTGILLWEGAFLSSSSLFSLSFTVIIIFDAQVIPYLVHGATLSWLLFFRHVSISFEEIPILKFCLK